MKRTTRLAILISLNLIILTLIGCVSHLRQNSTNSYIKPDIPTPNIPGDHAPYNFDYSWVEDNPYIAHAFGGIYGDSYTNSHEAFLLNYQLGHRIFEVDFFITDDEKIVAAHDAKHWAKAAHIPSGVNAGDPSLDLTSFTYDNFMSSLWYNKYHPIDLTELIKIMQDHPDIYIVTDTKFFDQTNVQKQFSAFYSAAAKVDLSILDRFIVQIYNPKMLNTIMTIYPWKSVIYTLYQNPDWTPENVVEFANQSGVKLITLPGDWISEDTIKLWQSSDITIAVHTVNQLVYANKLRNLGINLFYTDFLLPSFSIQTPQN